MCILIRPAVAALAEAGARPQLRSMMRGSDP
jgi:hypothetical protein